MKTIVWNFMLVFGITAQVYEDRRCICECPNPAQVLNNSLSLEPKMLIADVPPNQCDCVGVVLPRLEQAMKGFEAEYCFLCNCKYETRNTAVIKVVVVIIVWGMTLLLIYFAFLLCLNPLVKRERRPYQEPRNSEESHQLVLFSEEEEAEFL